MALDERGTAADPRDDAELLRAHVAGDPDAFSVVVARHRDRLWGLALRTTGNPEDASDCLQEALIKAYRGAGSFRGESAVSTWLHRVVVNACLDRHRHARSRPSTAVDDEQLERSADRATSREDTDVAARSAVRLDVERALGALPFDQRAAVVLVDVLGHDVATAAQMLGCPTGTVKSRCSRGRARLAVSLGHLAPGAGNLDGPGSVGSRSASAGDAPGSATEGGDTA